MTNDHIHVDKSMFEGIYESSGEAPRIRNNRVKTFWSDEGIESYQVMLEPHLLRLQQLWLDTPTKSCLSLLSA